MAPKSAEKAAKESPKKASPKKAAAADKGDDGPAGAAKTRAAESPAKPEKSPKKSRASEEEAVPAKEGPAAHTRAKEGDLRGTAAARATGTAAAVNALPQMTITDVLLGDHRDTVALLKHFEEVSEGGDKLMMEKLVDAIAITVRLHSQAEMEVLYPLMEKRLGGDKGAEARKHSAAEHAQIETDLLKALEQRKSGSKELVDTVKQVLEAFIHHMKEEEDEWVPPMLKGMSDEEQIELAVTFMGAKAKAPLEPQPEAAEAQAAE